MMKRGEVWWAALPDPVGSGPGKRRPVVVVQSDAYNESRVSTVIVVIITSNLGLAMAPANVRFAKSDSGLARPSVVNVSQLFTVDRMLLVQRIRMISPIVMAKIDEGLRRVLSV
jgi:mRNA interferase MazF